MKKKCVVSFITILLLVPFLASARSMLATASSNPSISFEQSNYTYTTSTTAIGTTFNVSILIQNAPDLGGVEVYMEYNDSIITATRWFEPTWNSSYILYGLASSTLPAPPNTGYHHIAPNRGQIEISVNKGGFPPVAPWAHSGLAMIIEFNITAVPTVAGDKFTTDMSMNYPDTFLLDPSGIPISPLDIQNGYYQISKPGAPPPNFTLTITATAGGTTNPAPGAYPYVQGSVIPVQAAPSNGYHFDHWELDTVNVGSANPYSVTMNNNHALNASFALGTNSRIFVDPPSIVNSTMVPGSSTFCINITIASVTGMKACEFNLTYDSYVIDFISIGFLRVGGQYPQPGIYADDIAGFIWVNLTYSNPVTVLGESPMVKITFLLMNLGQTPLNLTDTKITDPLGNLIAHDVSNGFFAALIHDIAVTNIIASPTWAYPGWPVNVTVSVKNNGNVNETFSLTAFYENNTIGVITVADLLSNEQRDILFAWDTTGVPEGNYTISAYATPVPYETHLSDNLLIDDTVWIMTKKHDVAITNVSVDSWAYQGWVMQINVTAQNLGDYNETFDVNAYYNTTILIGTAHIGTLGTSQNLTLQFNLDTSSLLPCHTYTISAQATPVQYEYNTTNNVLVDGGLTVRLMGDLNGDGKVNLIDYFEATLAFGSFPGHPHWDPAADLDRNLKINLVDIFKVAINFGKSCV
jgi:hypothetical protein